MQKNIESGYQLFSRVSQGTSLNGINPKLFSSGGPHPNQVIEVVHGTDVDKTNLLIDFIVRCILPSKYNSDWKESGVILINTDFQINLFRIIKVIETFILKYKISDSKTQLIESSLNKIIILDCYTFEQLQLTFYSLEKIINKYENIGLVILDNIAAQYWVAKSENYLLSYNQYSLHNFDKLYRILKDLKVVMIFAREERSSVRKIFSSKLDYSLEFYNKDENTTVVKDLENNTEITVPLKVSVTIEFE